MVLEKVRGLELLFNGRYFDNSDYENQLNSKNHVNKKYRYIFEMDSVSNFI
jgi:hypothetical protein